MLTLLTSPLVDSAEVLQDSHNDSIKTKKSKFSFKPLDQITAEFIVVNTFRRFLKFVIQRSRRMCSNESSDFRNFLIISRSMESVQS